MNVVFDGEKTDDTYLLFVGIYFGSSSYCMSARGLSPPPFFLAALKAKNGEGFEIEAILTTEGRRNGTFDFFPCANDPRVFCQSECDNRYSLIKYHQILAKKHFRGEKNETSRNLSPRIASNALFCRGKRSWTYEQ